MNDTYKSEFEQIAIQQATANALHYMKQAKTDIDAIFSDGYAEQHPELIAAYMQTAVIDFVNRSGLTGIAESLDDVKTAIDLHRLES